MLEKEFEKIVGQIQVSGSNAVLSVADLFKEAEGFNLHKLTNIDLATKNITVYDVYRPALVLAGYTGNFLPERVQILGAAEISYLQQLPTDERAKAIDNLLAFTEIPAIIISKSLTPPDYLINRAVANGIPVFQTNWDTTPFIHSLTSFLSNKLAPTSYQHGTLVDVHGVGLLLSGDSGIGKSEIALDLIERGHRLVADDVVMLKKLSDEVIMGYANERIGHNMEIRGVGIINVEPLFGIRSIRMQKRVEVVVNLMRWKPELAAELDRAGLDTHTANIFGVPISQVTIPIYPGKNITVICEVIAMRYMCLAYGRNMALEFEAGLRDFANKQRKTMSYLVEDTE